MGPVRFSFSIYTMLLGILISVIGTTFTLSHLTIWSFMVIGSLSVSGWLKSKVDSDGLVLYFIISVMGSLLFLLRSRGAYYSSLFLQLALLLKLGLAPFQFWVFKVLCSLDIPRLCFFLGPLKVGLLWLIVRVVHPSLALFSLSLLVGLTLLWLSSAANVVLYASGSCQLLILVFLGPSAFALYYSIYLITLVGFYWTSTGSITPFFAFLGLGALPPLPIFWAKVFALDSLPFINGALVLFVSVLRLWPYIRCSVGSSSTSHSSLFHCVLLILYPSCIVSLHW